MSRKRTRYFMVSFNPDFGNGKIGFGSIAFECDGFFSYSFLFDEIKKNQPDILSMVVISIYEFDNEYDYEEYKNNG